VEKHLRYVVLSRPTRLLLQLQTEAERKSSEAKMARAMHGIIRTTETDWTDGRKDGSRMAGRTDGRPAGLSTGCHAAIV
jgi:hypothetical protein